MAVTNTYRKTVTSVYNGVPCTASVTAVEQHGNVALIVAVDSSRAFVTSLYSLAATLEGGRDGVGLVVQSQNGIDLPVGTCVATHYGFNTAAGVAALRAGMARLGHLAIQQAVETA